MTRFSDLLIERMPMNAFETLAAEAAATPDGAAFVAAGFKLWRNGGNCTAWRLDIGAGRYILATDSDGGSHAPADGESYLIGLHSDDGEECGDISEQADSARGAIAAAEAMRARD